MGLWLARPRLADSGYGPCPDDHQSDKESWTESEHGSYLKISICHRTPLDASCSSSVVSSRHNSDTSSDGSQDSVPDAARFFSQSHFVQRDAHIRGVANKLLNTTPGMMPSQRRGHAAALPLSPIRSIAAAEPVTPLSVATTLYNSLTPELTPTESQKRRKIIAKSFMEHLQQLVEQVDAEEVAGKLYGIGILDVDERLRASDKSRCEKARAEELVQLVKWKLWRSPEWFVDVCKILRNCGVKVIAEVIDEVSSECPAEEMSMLSTGSGSTSVMTPVKQTCQVSYYDMIKKIEASVEEGGRKAASALILQYAEDQGVDKELVNQACLRGVALSTMELLLNVLNDRGDRSITNSKAECGRTPLHETCAALIADPADDHDSALESNELQRKKIELLLSHGANHCVKDKDGNTPLHLATLRCDCEAVSVLLRSGRRCINIINKCGNTALHIACRRGRLDIVKVLCTHRANTSTQNNKSKTALHIACLHNHIDTALYLAEHDQSTLDAYDKHHRTPLHICCKRGNSLLALGLLRLKNCFVFKMDQENKTPLHYAVDIENIGLVTAILQKDAETPKDPTRSCLMVDVQDKFGDTALHIAGRHGNKPIAKQLLNFKANDNILNEEGRNALEVAIESENCLFPKKMLRKRGWTERKRLKRRIKMRRTLTQSTLNSSYQQSDISETNYVSSSESEDDENYSIGRRGTV